MFKKVVQSVGRRLFLPPVVQRHGHRMPKDVRREVTRDLMILGVVGAASFAYSAYLHIKVQEMAEVEAIKHGRRQLNSLLNEPAKNFNSPTATEELTSPTADTPPEDIPF